MLATLQNDSGRSSHNHIPTGNKGAEFWKPSEVSALRDRRKGSSACSAGRKMRRFERQMLRPVLEAIVSESVAAE
jgi:hypothetical protein